MSLRERLLGRRVPPTPVALRTDFSPEADAAYDEHEAALRALDDAQTRGVDLDAARARVERAWAALDPFQVELLLTPLPPAVYDELIGDHPPTDEQRAQGYQWNPDTFGPALLAACVGRELPPEERMSEDDWREFARSGAAGHGEYVVLVNTALAVNDRTVSVHVGKGSRATPG